MSNHSNIKTDSTLVPIETRERKFVMLYLCKTETTQRVLRPLTGAQNTK